MNAFPPLRSLSSQTDNNNLAYEKIVKKPAEILKAFFFDIAKIN